MSYCWQSLTPFVGYLTINDYDDDDDDDVLEPSKNFVGFVDLGLDMCGEL